ncbi:MAG: hypothetical protein OXI22_03275 [Defluviicoccus sp.]|nr:hypothetical protein [Defluviicoccus sp.]MDE0382881.1 hypothetical protein [Defluviicoccus sp.]
MLPIPATAPMARAQPVSEPAANAKTVYAHVGRGSDEITGGLGILWTGPRLALGADFGIEGKQQDQTGGRETIEDAVSINLLAGVSIFRNETLRIVPFALLGMRTYKTTCPTGQSHLGFRCYADYEPERHWKINYGGGVALRIGSMAVGVRATGESVAGMLGYNF